MRSGAEDHETEQSGVFGSKAEDNERASSGVFGSRAKRRMMKRSLVE
mgnify:CR=1 FL=1